MRRSRPLSQPPPCHLRLAAPALSACRAVAAVGNNFRLLPPTVTDSSTAQSMSARAHSEWVTPVQQLTAPEPADLAPIDLVKIDLVPIDLVPIDLVPIDLVKIDLVKIDLVLTNLEKPAPIHSDQPAPFACRSHRPVCHRSAGSRSLESVAQPPNPSPFSNPSFSSPTFSNPMLSSLTFLPLLTRPFSSTAAVHRRCSLPSLPARLPLFDCPWAQRFPAASKFPYLPTDARSPHSGYAAPHSPRTTHQDRPSSLPHTPCPVPAPSAPGLPCTHWHRKISRQSESQLESASPCCRR